MRSARLARSTALFASLCLSACDCGGKPGLDGPSVAHFVELEDRSLASLGIVPFDVNRRDLEGPNSHGAQYGKTPEIIVQPGEGFLDVVLRSTDESLSGPRAFLLRITDDEGELSVTRAFEVPSLGYVMGFVRASGGDLYYATGTRDEAVTTRYPARNRHRSNVVRVYRVTQEGETSFDLDLDLARETANEDAEPIVRPTVAASARLGLAGDTLALVAGNNTAPDGNGVRHQKALATYVHALTGEVRATSGIWVSHSFDQRYLVDGDDLYELHLGDAYPRQIVVSRIRAGRAGSAFRVYSPKGSLGANNTYTRLGNMARVDAGDAAGAYLVLLATERTSATESRVSGSRDLGLVRLVADFASGSAEDAIDDALGETFSVSSAGSMVENRVRFLTDFHTSHPGARHVERPKLVALGSGVFIALYELWSFEGASQTFLGTYAMRIDGDGSVLDGPELVTMSHLPRGDDAFPYGGGAAWVTGDEVARTLTLHVVSPSLEIVETDVP